MRGKLVEDGTIPKTVRDSLLNSQKFVNPWGASQAKRQQRTQDLNVKQLAPGEKTDVLLFVRCTCSSDPRTANIARSLAKIFDKVQLDWTILGNKERCCGGPILRLGEKGLFELLREENIDLFSQYDFQRIVTICPHGYDTLVNKYPANSRSSTIPICSQN